jgi:chorismate mutase-like protein
MTIPSHKLAEFRKEIDEIDTRIHELILERARIVQQIGQQKSRDNGAVYRPGREAELLRNILARPAAPLGARAIYAIWRDLMSASTRMQGEVGIAVVRNDADEAAWLAAIENFGSDMEMSVFASDVQALEAVTNGACAIGILPYTGGEQRPDWWRHLLRQDARSLRIVARLPFLNPGPAAKNISEALVVAQNEATASGDDHSIFVFNVADEASRSSIHQAAVNAGLPPTDHQIYSVAGETSGRLHLIDVNGFVGAEDDRIATLAGSLNLGEDGVVRIGGYATPIDLET